MLVDQLRHPRGVREGVGLVAVVGPAPGVAVQIPGHGEELDVLHIQAHGLLGEPQDVVQGDVRLHIFKQDVGEGADLGPVLQLQALGRHRLEEGLLDLHPGGVSIVGAVAVLPPADHLHGVLPVQEAVALLLVDVEVLIGVVVVHGEGDVEPHAAQGLHHPAHSLPLHHHVEVRRHAGEVAHLGLQPLDPPAAGLLGGVDRVDPLDIPGDVDHGIPGDGEEVHRLVGYVVGHQHDGVRAAAGGILPHQEEGVVVLLPPGGRSRLLLLVRLGLLNRSGLLFILLPGGEGIFADVRGPDKGSPHPCHDQGQGRHRPRRDERDLLRPQLPPGLLSHREDIPILRAPGPTLAKGFLQVQTVRLDLASLFRLGGFSLSSVPAQHSLSPILSSCVVSYSPPVSPAAASPPLWGAAGSVPPVSWSGRAGSGGS